MQNNNYVNIVLKVFTYKHYILISDIHMANRCSLVSYLWGYSV